MLQITDSFKKILDQSELFIDVESTCCKDLSLSFSLSNIYYPLFDDKLLINGINVIYSKEHKEFFDNLELDYDTENNSVLVSQQERKCKGRNCQEKC